MRWSDLSDDPNSVVAVGYRRKQLSTAWASSVPARIAFFRACATGQRVLDVGCVNHESSTMADSSWLHRHIADVAEECLGVDILEEGIAHVRRAGFDAITLDINKGPNDVIRQRMPFDVVTAGELIEHLPSPQALFDFAAVVLRSGGTLVISTPNPYTLGRMRAGRLRVAWENVDHVSYLFPSGIAEMADRSGMTLVSAGTAGLMPFGTAILGSVRDWAKSVVKRLLGIQKERASGRLGLPLPMGWESPLDLLAYRSKAERLSLGESGVFVIEKTS